MRTASPRVGTRSFPADRRLGLLRAGPLYRTPGECSPKGVHQHSRVVHCVPCDFSDRP
jgi:hypothetical protein